MSEVITSIGEILIDFLPIVENGATVGFRMHVGGSPYNVAMGVARLGQPVAFAGKIATDFFGRFMRDHVEREGIDTRFLVNADALTTLAFVAYEHGEPAYSFYGEGAADTLVKPEDLPEALFDDTRILHFGSISLLRGSTPAAVEYAARRLKGQALLSFDPNLRPGLVRDEAAYRALLERLFRQADLVKISSADLAWLMPGVPLPEAAAALRAYGPALVVVTRGGEGALALRAGDNQAYTTPGVPVDVIDTIGAGDSFNGGLLAALYERGATSRPALEALSGAQVVECLRFAATVAAITCSRAGADPPTRAEVQV
ncbi:carbohydrate kinase family protein [Kouleothrix sp.]|uniref:carbohydrate kinase family protein n=1 Tax=Kouleothrix sp. TaxID=2779161 RepID=UPI00391DA2F8